MFDRTPDAVVEESLRKNRKALEMKRHSGRVTPLRGGTIHSVQREELYRVLCPSVGEKFDQLLRLVRKKPTGDEQKEIFAQIEKAASKYLSRIDVRLEDSVLDIVARPGAPFGRLRK